MSGKGAAAGGLTLALAAALSIAVPPATHASPAATAAHDEPQAEPGAAQAAGPQAAARERPKRRVVIAPDYAASGFYRWLFGTDYRPLWTAPIEVDELDLAGFAGGLTPVRRVGGQQTKGLALKGADGRDYTFRSIDKDPTQLLPEDLRDTWVRELVQDQMAGQHPAAPFVAEELMKAAGVLHTVQHLVAMPDDPALGEFQREFAGVVGQLYEFPQPRSADNPGFAGATEILKHKDFWARLQAGDARPDLRALLTARLLDLMIGDWDRHRDQWRWVKVDGAAEWQPLPDDRDQAFSRYEGLVLALTRASVPYLQSYSGRYPKMRGLAWNARDQDRMLLAGLERPAYEQAAADLQARLTDEVITRAVRRLPAAYLSLDGERLIRDLRGRRDALPQAALAFYRWLADKVKLYLPETPQLVELERRPDGDARLRVWRSPDGQPAGEPWYDRTLHAGETQEVQVYLGGAADRVVTRGEPDGIELRVIGGGRDVVDDRAGGGTRFYDTQGGELLAGPGSKLLRKPYEPPPPPRNAPWIPPRDWGRDTLTSPWLSFGSDLGLFAGAAVETQTFAFRKDPFSTRQVIRAGWSFGENVARADWLADFRLENSPWRVGWLAAASGIESTRYFGYGNESAADDPGSDFYKARQAQYSLTPVVGVRLSRRLRFDMGPVLKLTESRHEDEDTLINAEQPYGYGSFGAVGLVGLLELDTRVSASRSRGLVLHRSGVARGGALLRLGGRIWPKAWDVEETFGSVEGSAAAFLTLGGDRAPTLALRAGGKKVFGEAPFHEAASLGGGSDSFGFSASDGMLRGLPRRRYAGDGVVFGNADLRIYVSRLRLLLPGEWGLLGFGDVGRVYLEGESSDKWHTGWGGGLWIAWLDRANTLSVSFARSEGQNGIYFSAGFAF